MLHEPSLCLQRPETTDARLRELAARLSAEGLCVAGLLKAARRQPSLFGRRPESIEGNIRGVADRFGADGLTTQMYLQAALRQESLFVQTPDAIEAKIRATVEILAPEGLTVARFLEAARRQPSLFYQATETIVGHVRLCMALEREGAMVFSKAIHSRAEQAGTSAVLEWMLANPASLCLADDNFILRLVAVKIADLPPDMRVMNRSRRDTEELLIHRVDPTAKEREVGPPADSLDDFDPEDARFAAAARRTVLRGLIRAGVIKSRALK